MKTVKIVLVLAAMAVGTGTAAADQKDHAVLGCADPAVCGSPDCCAGCGRHCPCQPKVCQLQCGVKTEKKHTWCVECEEFCTLLPGKGERCCESCGDTCGGECCTSCSKNNPLPRCGRPKCVQKLVKKEYEVEVPVYKCVVRYLCGQCCMAEGGAPSEKVGLGVPPAPPIPPAPPVPEAPMPKKMPEAQPPKAPPPTTAKAPKSPAPRKGQAAPKGSKKPASKPAQLQSIGDLRPEEQ